MNVRSLLDVVVVGGGAVGASAAAALAQSGFAVALIEARFPTPVADDAALDARVVALSPASVRFVERLGAWPLPAGRAFAYRDMEVHAGDQRVHFGRDLVAEPTLGWIVELRALQARLLDVACAGGVAVHEARVIGCEFGEREARVELDDRSRLRARLVVSAEGPGSALRQAAGLAVVGRDYRSLGIVAHLRTEQPNPGIAFQRFRPGGPLALLPIDAGRSSLVWTRPAAEANELLALDEQAFCAAVSEASELRFGRVLAASQRCAFPLRLQLSERLFAKRLVLIGDSAHVVHPLAGLGLNLGLIDAAALRDVLVSARERACDLGSLATLSRFDGWRRSDTHLIAKVIDAIERGFGGEFGRVGAWLARGLGVIDLLPPIKRFFAAVACGEIGRVPRMTMR